KVKEAQDNLKKEHPDVAQNLDKLSDSLKNTWVSFTQELENNYKEFAKKGGKKEEIENNIKSLIDKGSKAAKDLQTEIDKALDDKTKKN
ncbi:hypothetical protein, partial [Neisseria meningitidis]|uniref:hypothetical protein n=1 Tax=Neisseria meningitidis TaxID=487 RepID=UPI001C56475B